VAEGEILAQTVGRLFGITAWHVATAVQIGSIRYAYRTLTTNEGASYPPLPKLSD